jgi:hypothetical protein
MLSRSQFVKWRQERRDAGETLKAIGARFGEVGRAPVEMAPGLRSPREPFSSACAHLAEERQELPQDNIYPYRAE